MPALEDIALYAAAAALAWFAGRVVYVTVRPRRRRLTADLRP